MRLRAATLMVTMALAGCSDSPAGPAGLAAPSPRHAVVTAGAGEERFKGRVWPEAQPVRLAPLPTEGVAIQRKSRVLFVGPGGRVLAAVRGFDLHYGAGPPDGDVYLRSRRKQWYRLDAGAARLMPVGGGPLSRETYDPSNDCYPLDRIDSGTLLGCTRTTRDGRRIETESTIELRNANGTRLLVPPLQFSSGGRVIGAAGHWRYVLPSPDGQTLLAQFSGECEVPHAFLAPIYGGRPLPVTGEADWDHSPESVGLGWARDGRVIVQVGSGACGQAGNPPGVYSYDVHGNGRLIYETSWATVDMWSS